MCVYRRAAMMKHVVTMRVIRRTDYAGRYVRVRTERNAKAMDYVVYQTRNPVTGLVVRHRKFA